MPHGITITEQDTSVLAPSQVAAGIPVVVGTAPINLSVRETPPVNEPVLAYTYTEAVQAVGYSDKWADYTLCEMIDSHFRLYQLAPVVLINVLDPSVTEHKETVSPASVGITNGEATIEVEGILLDTLIVQSSDGVTTYERDVDYTAAFDANGHVVITRTASGTIPVDTVELQVGYDKLKPSGVTNADIIGGVDGITGAVTGLELINQVFPRFGLVPGLIMAPGFSQEPEVAAVMTAKAGNINSHFKAQALTDIPADTVPLYTDAPAWKNDNNYTSERQFVTYPMVKMGDKKYHLSTQLAGVIGVTDAANDGVPYVSPSNKALQANGAVLNDETEIFLGPDQASFLNDQGIVTVLNFVGGWKLWGNRTGAYPASTDVKDVFIPVRRMFDWISNSIILTYWQQVDDPVTIRLIETVTDSINIWLNGLTSAGYLLGGRVEFLSSENPTTDLLDGILRFHVYITPPTPAEEIAFVLEYDSQYLQTLFAA